MACSGLVAPGQVTSTSSLGEALGCGCVCLTAAGQDCPDYEDSQKPPPPSAL